MSATNTLKLPASRRGQVSHTNAQAAQHRDFEQRHRDTRPSEAPGKFAVALRHAACSVAYLSDPTNEFFVEFWRPGFFNALWHQGEWVIVRALAESEEDAVKVVRYHYSSGEDHRIVRRAVTLSSSHVGRVAEFAPLCTAANAPAI